MARCLTSPNNKLLFHIVARPMQKPVPHPYKLAELHGRIHHFTALAQKQCHICTLATMIATRVVESNLHQQLMNTLRMRQTSLKNMLFSPDSTTPKVSSMADGSGKERLPTSQCSTKTSCVNQIEFGSEMCYTTAVIRVVFVQSEDLSSFSQKVSSKTVSTVFTAESHLWTAFSIFICHFKN